MFLRALVISVFLIENIQTLSLPSYIKPCSFSDPEFEKCALLAATDYLQHLFEQGDENLKIRPITQVKFPGVYLNNTKDVYINITDAAFEGLNYIFHSIKKIPEKNRIEVVLSGVPCLKGNFVIDAKIGDVIIAGRGPGVWSLDKITVDIAFEWQIKEKYIDITKVEAALDMENPKIVLDVDPGNDLNKLISQNMEEIVKQVYPTNIYYAKRIFFLLTNTLFTSVPSNEIFLD